MLTYELKEQEEKMKKRSVVLMAGLLICSMLCGCGGQQTDPGTSQSGSTATKAPEEESSTGNGENTAEITFPLEESYTVEAFAFSNTGQELDKTLTMQVMEEKTNIHWDLTMVSRAELEEKRNLSFNGGDYYDVYIRSGISAIDTYKYAAQGIIIPLNDLIDQYMPNLKSRLDAQDAWGA